MDGVGVDDVGVTLPDALGVPTLEDGCNGVVDVAQLVDRHVRPVPRLREGRLLSERKIARAMIDISDGLLADAHHLATESGLGAEIDLSRMPLSAALQKYAEAYGAVPLTLALEGGEDYELLFSADAERRKGVERLAKECACPITRIGKLSRRIQGVVLKDKAGRTKKVDVAGFDHFRR